MFKKNLKLFTTVIGLVAVLVMGLAMPGVTQQAELPSRAQIVKGLSQLIATFTASEGDILDFENAGFISHPQLTAARIPLHPSSRSAQLLEAWLKAGEPFGDYLYIGAFYLENDAPSYPLGCDLLKAGIYHLKIRKDLKLIAVDSRDNEFVVGYVTVERPSSSDTPVLDASSGPLPIFGLLLLICATQDVTLGCITHRTCKYVQRSPGVYEYECTEEKWCLGC